MDTAVTKKEFKEFVKNIDSWVKRTMMTTKNYLIIQK